MVDVPLPVPGSSDRTRVRRLARKAVEDRSALNAVLDMGLVAHVAVVDEDQPFALPVAFARDGDRLLLHGSTGSRLFRVLAAGAPACVTVTLIDALVLARSVFESSMNYRSAMVLGRCTPVEDADKMPALQRLVEHLMPGRWAEARQPNQKELAAVWVLAMPLDECSLKISDGGPRDPEEDLKWPVWAGEVPINHGWGDPVPADTLLPGLLPPSYLREWPAGRT